MSAIKKHAYSLRATIRQAALFLRAKVPEKIIIVGSYAANVILVALHFLVLRGVGETLPVVQVVDFIVAIQLLLPALFLDLVPLLHYIAIVSLILAGSLGKLVPLFPIYYYTLTLDLVVTVTKLEPVLTTSPTIIKIATRIKRATKKARFPTSAEELKFSLKLGLVHIVSILASVIIYAWKLYPPAILVATYSAVAFMFFFFNIGANPLVTIPKGKYSTALLFVLKYPFLFRLANKLKMRIHPLTEKAGVLIYELEYVSRYIAILIWYLMVLPTLILTTYVTLPVYEFVIALPIFLATPAIIYYIPVVSLTSKAKARKQGVEREYPVFLAYATALVSAGYTLYSVFKDLAFGKGAELLDKFTKEAKFLLALVEKQGLTELKALERYAATHPSSEFRNFILGYLHQRQLGGRISVYMEQKLMEALDALKRRMEAYVNQVVTLTEIALTVLVIPTLPMIIGFIIAPDIVYGMLFAQMFVFIPAVGFLFYSVASAIQLEFKDRYRFTYIPSVIGAVVGLVVGALVAYQKLLAGIALVIGAAAIGYYAEFISQRKIFVEIEKTLPQLFRDLSELRHMMPIAEALGRMTKMGYPKNVARILRRVHALRTQGFKISEQPWHSRSWSWKFTQLLLGKIEESGGGSVELFRQMMLFFTEFNNIIASVKANLRIYEFVIYAIPAIFGVVTYSTLGIFVAMAQVSEATGLENIDVATMSQLGAQFPQLMRIFRGLDPIVLTVNDVIIFEMSFILGLLGGKITSGTLKDTRALAISMIIAAMVLMLAPQFVTSIIQSGIPTVAASP